MPPTEKKIVITVFHHSALDEELVTYSFKGSTYCKFKDSMNLDDLELKLNMEQGMATLSLQEGYTHDFVLQLNA